MRRGYDRTLLVVDYGVETAYMSKVISSMTAASLSVSIPDSFQVLIAMLPAIVPHAAVPLG